MSFPQEIEEHKVRGKPEKFAEHYNQATLFWNSQSAVEKLHIVRAYRFELTKVQTPSIRERVVAQLRNVADELAQAVADGLGMPLPEPLPRVLRRNPKPEVVASQSLSLLARPGEAGIRTRRIAILVADGVDGESARAIHESLIGRGAVPRFVGVKLGAVQSSTGDPLPVEITLETAPSVLWDGVIVSDKTESLGQSGHAIEFIKDQYRHCKTILLLGSAAKLLDRAGIPATLPSGKPDEGLLTMAAKPVGEAEAAFSKGLARHRHFERDNDPPMV